MGKNFEFCKALIIFIHEVTAFLSQTSRFFIIFNLGTPSGGLGHKKTGEFLRSLQVDD